MHELSFINKSINFIKIKPKTRFYTNLFAVQIKKKHIIYSLKKK